MKLNQLTFEHLERCANLLVAVFANPPWNEPWTFDIALERLRDIFNTPGFYGIVAQVDEGVIGCALGHATQYIHHKTFFLLEMCVTSEYQRCGVGTAMMTRLQRDLKKRDVGKIWLLTLHDSPAQSFYEKCGFCIDPKLVFMMLPLFEPNRDSN